ncbi:MAG: TetR/AcrR family transcriptional regulator [bacterium]
MEKTKFDIKNRIVAEAKSAFAKNGYSKVNTQFLANELGISKRTLYEHFPSKERLLEEIIDRDLKEIKLHLDNIVKEIKKTDSDFLYNLNRLWNIMSKTSYTFSKEFFEDLRKYAPGQWKKIESFRAKQIKSNFTKLHSIGVKRGIIKSNINKDVFYLIYYYSLHFILVPEVLSELPVTNQDALKNIIDVLLTGSLTEKGRTDYSKIC